MRPWPNSNSASGPPLGPISEAINSIHGPEVLHGTATWDTEPWTLDQRREWFSHHDAMNPVLVAEHQGEVVGFAYVTLVSQKTGWRFTREDTIYIDERFRGQGVGDLLLGALLAPPAGARCPPRHRLRHLNQHRQHPPPRQIRLRSDGRDEECRLQVRPVAQHHLHAG
ncbi:MAG: GNAT family N-acetyltransferase [Dehalococcoidia bacterium]|nr:GNAT family N-acetyltransferase [Dehalococcoidia bacterium]